MGSVARRRGAALNPARLCRAARTGRHGLRAATRVGMAAAAILVIGGLFSAHAAPTLDDRIDAIAKDLMCPVCSGQTVADSNSQLAGQMRQIIRERLQAGQTREEIIAYFVAQFGEGVLASPPPHGGGLVLWLSLPVALVAGVFIIRHFIRRNAAASRPLPAPPPPTPAETEEIERELRRLE
jgi:cytochrome c-type biogenesis protein CcmH